MKNSRKLITALVIILLMGILVSNIAFADNEVGSPEDPIDILEYYSGDKAYYSDGPSNVNLGTQSEKNVTIHNNGPGALYVSMYQGSTYLWSDYIEGGLAANSSRTYYVGANVTKVTVQGYLFPGTYWYSY